MGYFKSIFVEREKRKKSIIEEEEDGIEVKSEGKVKKSQICHPNPPIDRVIEPEHSVQRDLTLS